MFLKWFLILTLIYSTTLREEISFLVKCACSFSAETVAASDDGGEYEDDEELPTSGDRDMPAMLEIEDDLQAEDLLYVVDHKICFEKMSFRWLFEIAPLQSLLVDSPSTFQKLLI